RSVTTHSPRSDRADLPHTPTRSNGFDNFATTTSSPRMNSLIRYGPNVSDTERTTALQNEHLRNDRVGSAGRHRRTEPREQRCLLALGPGCCDCPLEITRQP